MKKIIDNEIPLQVLHVPHVTVICGTCGGGGECTQQHLLCCAGL